MENDPAVGALEPPESLLQALTGRRGDESPTNITDLPALVVGSILSRLSNPIDVVSTFRASRIFWALARYAPFRLRLRETQCMKGSACGGISDETGWGNKTGYDAHRIAAWTRAALTGIRAVMESTEELDLGGCPILDDDVAAVLADLHCLDRLVLDGCQKLTSAVADALAISVRSGPRVISLQRCFRLGPIAAGNLLAAASADGSHLQSILLSHLDRLDIPREPPLLEPLEDANEREIREFGEIVKSTANPSIGGGLRILALNNCGSLGSSQLTAISETCPLLELLLLGGSMEGLGLCRPDDQKERVIAAAVALSKVAESLSRLCIFEITFFGASVLHVVREHVRKDVYVWDFCDKNSLASAAAMVTSFKSCQMIPGVEAYLPFVPEEALVWVGKSSHDFSMGSETCAETGKQCSMTVFESHPSKGRPTRYMHQSQFGSQDTVEDDVLMALRAAANCSDMRKRTPLHVAAAGGDPKLIASLLAIGASPKAMKDSGGATAIFVAAESGHALACELLLKGGADVLASNRAGETPLYIAALRGHSAAVEIMLNHCHKHGVNWQDADVYGDGWTPLMAATVADRQDVGKVLLCAVGATGAADPLYEDMCRLGKGMLHVTDILDGAPKQEEAANGLTSLGSNVVHKSFAESTPAVLLLDAKNRYGQTALHIAARQNSVWFVGNLLSAGASSDIQDEYGLRAVDVARRQSHKEVENLLKHWDSLQKKKKGDSNQASSSKHRNLKKTSKMKQPGAGSIPDASSGRVAGCHWVPKLSLAGHSKEIIVSGASTSDSPQNEDVGTLAVDCGSLGLSRAPFSSPVEHFPLLAEGSVDVENSVGLVSIELISDSVTSETTQINGQIEDSNRYWRGRGIRRRTDPENCCLLDT